MICRVCNGVGSIPGFWLGSINTCTTCHGSGTRDTLTKEINLVILEKRISIVEENLTTTIKILDKLTKTISNRYEY